jgi:hypothetical protein
MDVAAPSGFVPEYKADLSFGRGWRGIAAAPVHPLSIPADRSAPVDSPDKARSDDLALFSKK